jgi:hypothetical protein
MPTNTHNALLQAPTTSGMGVSPQPRSETRSNLLIRSDIDNPESVILACFFVVLIIGSFLFSSDRFQHWFLVPLAICGVLTGIDGIAWIRGRVDIYDLIGILGLFGFHFFFLAPLLHVYWDIWIDQVSPPPEWRDWLGYMGLLNVAGLVAYRVCRNLFKINVFKPVAKTSWRIDHEMFRLVGPLSFVIAAGAQVWLFARMGGVGGYIEAIKNDPTTLQGMGWFLMISESAPILAMFLIVVHFQHGKMSWSKALGVLLVLFILQMVFAGLRGSRSQTLVFLFWLVGCVHFLIRPVPRKLIYAGSVFLMLFLYLYAFYKAEGAAGLNQAFSGSEERQQLSQKTGRTFAGLILGDLARADIQAFILYKLLYGTGDFTYAKGETYIGALAVLIPRAILPDRPENKLKWGTDIQSGTGHYVPGVFRSSRVYGLSGEAMLNFGPISVPFIYALLGLLVGWTRTKIAQLLPGDARFLLAPLAIYICIAAQIGDSDNLVWGIVKDGFVPTLVVAVCSAKRKLFVPYALQPTTRASATPPASPVSVTEASVRMNGWRQRRGVI